MTYDLCQPMHITPDTLCDRVVQLPYMQIADDDCLLSISKRVECAVHRRIQ